MVFTLQLFKTPSVETVRNLYCSIITFKNSIIRTYRQAAAVQWCLEPQRLTGEHVQPQLGEGGAWSPSDWPVSTSSLSWVRVVPAAPATDRWAHPASAEPGCAEWPGTCCRWSRWWPARDWSASPGRPSPGCPPSPAPSSASLSGKNRSYIVLYEDPIRTIVLTW